MKYIIMANGKGTRWNNYKNIPKHFLEISGERIIERTINLIKKYDPNNDGIIISSHDQRYEFNGTTRYEPKNNEIELDRFVRELIEDNICFLYGDTYYTDRAIQLIIKEKNNSILFFGNYKSIVAIKVFDSKVFKKHLENVRTKYLNGEIKNCIGWQVYQSFENLPFDEKNIKNNFIIFDDNTTDCNTPEEYENLNQIINSTKK